MTEKTFEAGKHDISQAIRCERLVISPGAELFAPEGKYLALCVNGSVLPVKAGEYQGSVVLSPVSYYIEAAYPSVNRSEPIELETAVCVVDGEVREERCVPEAAGGNITGRCADELYMGTSRGNLAGIIIDGDTDYTINRARIEMEGAGLNDFVGMGAGVAALGDSRVTINDSDINLASVTRCCVHAGGKSVVTANNCRFTNFSPDAELGSWSWGISVRGTNRLCQLADDAEVHYNGCELTSNGWGVLSVDGSNYAKMFVKDSHITLTGPRSHGYGVFCIGPTPVSLDHTTVDVNGFPILMMSMERKGSVELKNGSLLTGRRYGIHLTSDSGGVVTVQDSAIKTDKSAIVAKTSNTHVVLKNAVVEAKNGVILQMMDSDDPGLAGDFIDVSMYETMEDEYIAGRDLTAADPLKDMFVSIFDSSLTGDFFNSTTNLPEKAGKTAPAGIPKRPGIVPPGRLAGSIPGSSDNGAPPPPPPASAGSEGGPVGMPEMGPPKPKNLRIRLNHSSVRGAISSAKQHYRPGISYIEETTREELCNVTQEAAPTVNNGVIVLLENGAVWTPRGSSFLTALTVGSGCAVNGEIYVDGKKVSGPGSYKGAIIVKEA